MSQIDIQVTELRKALAIVATWPYQKERDKVLLDVMNFAASQLGYNLVMGETCQSDI